MSETVKLIIDIPKEDYLKAKGVNWANIRPEYVDDYEYQIAHGIPLDKAEIEKKCDRINSIASVLRYPQHREIQELLCEILNSIGKGDSE